MIPPIPRNPELEAALFAGEPAEQGAAWKVYADYLHSEGHPLGELIALESQFVVNEPLPDPALTKEIRRHIDAILRGWELDFHMEKPDELGFPTLFRQRVDEESEGGGPDFSTVELTWVNGMVQHIVIKIGGAEGLEDFLVQVSRMLASPSLLFLRGMNLYVLSYAYPGSMNHPLQDDVNNFLKLLPGGEYLNSFLIRTRYQAVPDTGIDVTPILSRLPRLKTMYINARVTIQTWPEIPLRSLSLGSRALPAQWPELLGSPKLPDLESLELHLDDGDFVQGANLFYSLRKSRLRKLSKLSLFVNQYDDAVLHALSVLNLPALEELRLSVENRTAGPELQEFFQDFLLECYLPGLKRLELKMVRLEKESLQELIGSLIFSGLQELVLGNMEMDDECFQVILDESSRFSQLEYFRPGNFDGDTIRAQKLVDVYGPDIL